MKKSINLDNVVLSDSGTPIAFFNARISIGHENISLSMNIPEEKSILENAELFKREFSSFIEEIKNEAINNGWDALKDTETQIDAIEE